LPDFCEGFIKIIYNTALQHIKEPEDIVKKKTYDIIIIGAGITGCLMARNLSFYGLDIAVIEKSGYVCSGQSKANGAIVHAGHNERPGTLKAKLCVEGNRLFPELCSQLGVFFKKTGYVILAFDDEEIRTIQRLREQSIKNGVDVEIISRERLMEIEPNASPEAICALRVKDAGYTDVHRLVIAAAEHAAVNGSGFIFNTEITDLLWKHGKKTVSGVTDGKEEYFSRLVINCAGADADRIINRAGNPDFTITARRGEYYIIDKAAGDLVNGAVYPVPSPLGKGCAVIPTANGNTIMGGNSIETDDRNDTSTSRTDFKDVYRQSLRLVPALKGKEIIAAFSGIRSSVPGRDYIIGPMPEVRGLINVTGIDSPGLTSSPAIAGHVKDMIGDKYFDLVPHRSKRKDYRIMPLFRDLDSPEKEKWLRQEPLYGRIVCRCEDITEGDVISAIHSPIPAFTADALKFKTRVGTGRCQGSFDLPRLISILSRELDIDPAGVLKNETGSNFITGHSRKT
jgi:glycerol-3-phosphate dehydrogenase